MSNRLVEMAEKNDPHPNAAPATELSGGLRSSILETIGNTPVVRLNRIGPPNVRLYAKLEAFNPMGSVKDRIARAVIEEAERSGVLKPGQTVIEATSGNTGIGLAMVCAQKGYPLVIVMAENFSLERRKLLRFLGAKVILTSAAERGTGMFRTAKRLAEANGWFFVRQFENEANAAIHSETTAREILDDFEGETLDYWVTGFGTGGTLKGVARRLKRESPRTQVVVAEPENAQILASGIVQLRNPDGSAARSHPNSRAHPMQGWTPDFIPKLVEDAQNDDLIDRLEPVSGHDALSVARDLARKEGIFCGISGGATVAAALTLAQDVPADSTILAMIPDTGERYLSTPLFDGIPVEMTEEERALAATAPAPPRRATPKTAELAVPISDSARAFVKDVLNDPSSPIVMFGFEWCEFCWSVRRLFTDTGVPFKSIDVDSTEYREGDRGGDILRALFDRTGMRTVPQVFVGGQLIGGASELLVAAGDGTLQDRLAALHAPIPMASVHDPMEYLPNWVPRKAPPAGSGKSEG